MISLSVHLPMDTFWQSISPVASSRFLLFFRRVCVWDLPKWPPDRLTWPPGSTENGSGSQLQPLIHFNQASVFMLLPPHTETPNKPQPDQPSSDALVLFNLRSSTIGKINPSLMAPPVINPVVFISHGSVCIKDIPLDIRSPSFCSSSQQFVSWCDRLPLSPPQWHLALLICIYMPSLCGLWAAEIDQQFPGLLHTSLKSECHTQHVHMSVSVCVVYFHTYIHACTLETWLNDRTRTSTSDGGPYGSRARTFSMKAAFTVVF